MLQMQPHPRVGMSLLAVLAAATCLGGAALAGTVPVETGARAEAGGAAELAAPADLVIANRHVYTFRAAIIGIPPRGRAEAARARIHSLLEEGRAGGVELQEISEGLLVTVAGQGVFRILQVDLDPESDDTVETLGARTKASLDRALEEERALRDLPRLLRSLAWAALATMVFLVCAGLLGRGARWMSVRLERFAAKSADRFHPGGFTVLGAEKAADAARRLVAAAKWVAWLAAAYVWVAYVLDLFPWTRPWGEGLGGYLLLTTSTIVAAVASAVPGLLLVVVIVVVTRYLTRLVNAFFRAVQQGTVSVSWVSPDTADATRRILVVVLWLFALVLSYPYLPGSSSDAFKGVSVLTGLMLSLGSTTLIGQVLSGFIIIYGRTFRPGDYVRVGETEGTVSAIGLFATKIETIWRERISIPNSVVLGGQVKNYSRLAGDKGLVLNTSVTIGYGAPWRQVHALLKQAADRTPGLLKDPAPFVLQTALSDFYVEYQINAHLDKPEERLYTLAALHANIQDTFNEHGVQILSPHYIQDPDEPVWVPREKWFTPPAEPE